MIGAQAAEIDVFVAIGRWTDETFYFTHALPTDGSTAYKETGDTSHLQDALRKCRIPKQTAPTRLPEGFEMSVLEVLSGNLSRSVYCSFSGTEDKFFTLQIDRFNSADDVVLTTFEKDGGVSRVIHVAQRHSISSR